MGHPEFSFQSGLDLVRRFGLTVLSVDHRLALSIPIGLRSRIAIARSNGFMRRTTRWASAASALLWQGKARAAG
jgi:hypothetical protein